MDSLVPCYLYPLSPWHHYNIWPRTRSDLILSMTSFPYDTPSALDPDHTYSWLLLALITHMMDIPLISDVLYNAMTHLGLCHWLIPTYLWQHCWLILTLWWLIPTTALLGYVICLCSTNISLHYISRSIPSLYSRLDFFYNHDIVSRTRQGTLGLFHWGLSSSSLMTIGLWLCLTYLTECRPSICLAPASLECWLNLAFHSHQSWAQLDLILVHHWTEALIQLHT